MKTDFEAWSELELRVRGIETDMRGPREGDALWGVLLGLVFIMMVGLGGLASMERRLILERAARLGLEGQLELHLAQPHASVRLLRTVDCHPCWGAGLGEHQGVGVDHIYEASWPVGGGRRVSALLYPRHEARPEMIDPCVTHNHWGCGGMVLGVGAGRADQCPQPEDDASIDRPCGTSSAPITGTDAGTISNYCDAGR